ncbi:MAG: hypothetical protein ACXV5O_00375 [Candidatus Aminicenantales bacterium]
MLIKMAGRIPWILLLVVFFEPRLSAQSIIENPEKPQARNAGRVLELREVWRITDDAEGRFYFKYPHALETAPDGSFFLADEKQLLRFTSEGKFLKNLYKKGQGPGEIAGSFSYALAHDAVCIQDYNSKRIFMLDMEGKLSGPADPGAAKYHGFFGIAEDGYLLINQISPPPEARTGKLLDYLYAIVLVPRVGKNEKDLGTFPVKVFEGPKGGRTWAQFFNVLNDGGKFVFVSHTTEYLIARITLNEGRVTQRFRRKYIRVPHKAEEWEKEFLRNVGGPEMEFENDISGLFPNQDWLWVQTSTRDKDKGDLFDVFDASGSYIDNFYLGRGRSLLKAIGREIFVLQKDPQESWLIVKYKIN